MPDPTPKPDLVGQVVKPAGVTTVAGATSIAGSLAGVTPVTGGPTPIPTPGPAPVALTPANPSVTTTTPSIAVTIPNTSGTAKISLVVTDDLGVPSTNSAVVVVTIQPAPTAVVTPGQITVTPGGTINLSGAGSTSSGGTIQKFTFTLNT